MPGKCLPVKTSNRSLMNRYIWAVAYCRVMSQDSWFLFGSHSISCCSSVSSFCSCWFPLVAGRTIQFLFSEFPLDAELRQRPTTQDRLERGQRAGFDDFFCLGNSMFFLVSCGIDVWNLSSLSHLRYPNFQANPYCITMFCSYVFALEFMKFTSFMKFCAGAKTYLKSWLSSLASKNVLENGEAIESSCWRSVMYPIYFWLNNSSEWSLLFPTLDQWINSNSYIYIYIFTNIYTPWSR